MCAAHNLEIEFLRKNIENITIPAENYSPLFYNSKKIEKAKKNNSNKTSKNIIDFETKIKIEKNFEESYNIYKNDRKYKLSLKGKKFKEVHYDSIHCRAIYNPKKKKNKFNIDECLEVLEQNAHQVRNEAEFEDEFYSSDSYDTELFNMKSKVNKNFIIKTKKNMIDNINNLNEIIDVIKLCQNGEDNINAINNLQ